MGFLAPIAATVAAGIGSIGAGAGSVLASAGTAIGAGASALAGAGTAAGAASSSLDAGSLSTILNVGGDIVSGIGGLQEGLYKSAVAKANAANSLQAGQYAGEASKIRTGQTIGAQKAAFAANGVDVSSGSPQDVMNSTKAFGDLDAMMLKFNAERESQGYRMEAAMAKRAGVGRFVGGLFGAGQDFLSGANSLGDKWSKLKNSGALTVPSGNVDELARPY